VLFDEIEKADPGVAKVLLQILDDGLIEDSDGNPLDFRRSFIVFTTNAGCIYEDHRIGFGNAAQSRGPHVDVDMVKDELRSLGYGEEFLGRVGHFFVFEPLEPHEIRIVLERQLARLRRTADSRGFDLTWDPEVIDHLASIWQPRFGVRHLSTILRHRIIEQLSVADAQGELRGVSTIRLGLEAERTEETRGAAGGAGSRERAGDVLTIRVR
jgi:ATP-dependent Clp protease ATP-binding subunit ClpA